MSESGQVSRFERWWLDWWPHRLHIRHYVPKFLRACPEAFRGEVLEVGAGSGWTSRRILETFPQVELTALDTDPSIMDSLAPLGEQYGRRLKVENANAEELPFNRDQFDIVIVVHAMHHVENVQRVIQELIRVVRPGGMVGIADEDQRYVVGPLKWLWKPATPLNRARIRDLISAEAEVLVDEGAGHYYLWARKPYQQKLGVKSTS